MSGAAVHHCCAVFSVKCERKIRKCKYWLRMCVPNFWTSHTAMRKFLTFLILLLSITGQPSEEWVIYGPLTFLRRFCHHSRSWSLWHMPVSHAADKLSSPSQIHFLGFQLYKSYWLKINSFQERRHENFIPTRTSGRSAPLVLVPVPV